MSRIDDIFVVPVLDRFLVYAPLNGQSALLNKSAVLLLKSALLDLYHGRLEADFSALIDLLTEKTTASPARNGPVLPEFLGIIPSRRCNMSCAYCDFGAHQQPGSTLDPEQMTAAIDWYATHLLQNERRHLNIQFFGGEPFVEQEHLDIAVHHARLVASRTGLIPSFEVLSNGLWSTQQQRFARDYFDRIVISLDGYQKHHDRTRSGSNSRSSYQHVIETLYFLSNQNIDLSIRCCITAESVLEMEEMSEWFCHEFQPDKVNFETLTENDQTRANGIEPPDPYEFAAHCIKSWRILRSHHVEPAYAALFFDHPQTTSCPVGRDVAIVHPDGMIASCYLQKEDWQKRGMDLATGRVNKNGHVEIDEQKLLSMRNMHSQKMRCSNCFCRYGCAGGCHVNNTYPNASHGFTDFCIHTRIMTACRLLEMMGMTELTDELLLDYAKMQRLALFATDKIADYDEKVSIKS